MSQSLALANTAASSSSSTPFLAQKTKTISLLINRRVSSNVAPYLFAFKVRRDPVLQPCWGVQFSCATPSMDESDTLVLLEILPGGPFHDSMRKSLSSGAAYGLGFTPQADSPEECVPQLGDRLVCVDYQVWKSAAMLEYIGDTERPEEMDASYKGRNLYIAEKKRKHV